MPFDPQLSNNLRRSGEVVQRAELVLQALQGRDEALVTADLTFCVEHVDEELAGVTQLLRVFAERVVQDDLQIALLA